MSRKQNRVAPEITFSLAELRAAIKLECPAGSFPYDLHTHTQFSDGKDEVEMMVRTAAALGIKCIAITDHYREGSLTSKQPLDEYLQAIEIAARNYPELTVLRGAEGTALGIDGGISVEGAISAKLDLLLIDFGFDTQGVAKNIPRERKSALGNVAQALVGLCENPLVDIVAHPFNLGRWLDGFNFDWFEEPFLKEIAACFAETNTCFEIMEDMWWWFPDLPIQEITRGYGRVLRIFDECNVRFTFGSDSHSHQGVGHIGYIKQLLVAAGSSDL